MKLTALKKLCDKMAPAPWGSYDSGFPRYPGVVNANGTPVVHAYSLSEDSGLDHPEIAEFISAARNALPTLIAVAEAAELFRQVCPTDETDKDLTYQARLTPLFKALDDLENM